MLQLHFKRAKSFVANVNGGTRKFLAQPAMSVQACPNWIKHTTTYEHGIKDGSIVDLTPPVPVAPVPVPVPEPEVKPAPVAVSTTTNAIVTETIEIDPAEDIDIAKSSEVAGIDDAEKQKDEPQAPFGSQTLPSGVPPKSVGQVRSATNRTNRNR